MRTVIAGMAFVVASLCSAAARAETHDLLLYTPPPGWGEQQDAAGKVYVRKDAGGTGIIMVFASRAAGGAPAEVFAEEWRDKVQPVIAAAPPRPTVQPAGEMTAAIGATPASFQGQAVTVSFVTFVARGRAQSVVGITTSQERLTQALAFFDGLRLAPAPASAPPAAAAPAGDVELDVEAPPGYAARREGGSVVIAPLRRDRDHACSYVVAPSRPSRGSLEADAQAAFAEAFAGWRKLRPEEHNPQKRGLAAAGWRYFWYRADLERPSAAGRDVAIGLVMVIPGGPGRVNVVWGTGDLAHCTFEDLGFARLFHGLRPRGVASDGGKALARELVGSWILSTGSAALSGKAVYIFHADGRYQYGQRVSSSADYSSASTPLVLETTSGLYHEGRWTLRDGELHLLRDGRKEPTRERVRLADERSVTWVRALYLLDGEREVQYLRQGWTPPR